MTGTPPNSTPPILSYTRDERVIHKRAIMCLCLAFIPECMWLASYVPLPIPLGWVFLSFIGYVGAPVFCVVYSWLVKRKIQMNASVYKGLAFVYGAIVVSFLHLLLVAYLITLLVIAGFPGHE